VGLMGGKIELQSSPGKGARFECQIPLLPAERHLQALPSPEALKGIRVLVVDDHEVNRQILHNQVSAWGMPDECVPSAFDALESLRLAARSGSPFRIVLLDMHMPGMSGLELASALRAEPILGGMRLVMLSSVADMHQEAKAVGVVRYLSKPVRRSVLKQCLVELLSGEDT